jgi:hypothetical protein
MSRNHSSTRHRRVKSSRPRTVSEPRAPDFLNDGIDTVSVPPVLHYLSDFGALGGTPEKSIRKRKWNPLNELTSKHRSINRLPNTHFEGSTPAASTTIFKFVRRICAFSPAVPAASNISPLRTRTWAKRPGSRSGVARFSSQFRHRVIDGVSAEAEVLGRFPPPCDFTIAFSRRRDKSSSSRSVCCRARPSHAIKRCQAKAWTAGSTCDDQLVPQRGDLQVQRRARSNQELERTGPVR